MECFANFNGRSELVKFARSLQKIFRTMVIANVKLYLQNLFNALDVINITALQSVFLPEKRKATDALNI
jgi:hypothetical protein